MNNYLDWIPTIAVKEHIFWLIKDGLLLNLPVHPGVLIAPGAIICFEMQGDSPFDHDRKYCYATIWRTSRYKGLGANLSTVDLTLIAFTIHRTLDDLYIT
jgi:hypothetical protein